MVGRGTCVFGITINLILSLFPTFKLSQLLVLKYHGQCTFKGKHIFGGISDITKTRLYKFDPFKPHFYIVKLGFTRVYSIFLILLKNIDCRYSLEPPCRGGSNEYPQSIFLAEL